MGKSRPQATPRGSEKIFKLHYTRMNHRVFPVLLFLGLMPASGQQVPPADLASVQAAAEKGEANGQFELAKALLQGTGLKKDGGFRLLANKC
jgi:TPR repeat protein